MASSVLKTNLLIIKYKKNVIAIMLSDIKVFVVNLKTMPNTITHIVAEMTCLIIDLMILTPPPLTCSVQ